MLVPLNNGNGNAAKIYVFNMEGKQVSLVSTPASAEQLKAAGNAHTLLFICKKIPHHRNDDIRFAASNSYYYSTDTFLIQPRILQLWQPANCNTCPWTEKQPATANTVRRARKKIRTRSIFGLLPTPFHQCVVNASVIIPWVCTRKR